MEPSNPIVDASFTIRLPFVRYYVVFRLGRDRRQGNSGVERERRSNSGYIVALFYATVFFWLSMSGIVAALIAVYLFKNALGIDLLRYSHPLREALSWFGMCH